MTVEPGKSIRFAESGNPNRAAAHQRYARAEFVDLRC
jgi:hypothetical protein